VDLNSLTFWFPIVAGKFNVPELKLKVIEQDGLAKCNCCLQQFHLINLFDPCPHCASYGDYQILQGREMLIKSFALDLASSK
jgi:Zn finger protein HypA/HybF involved in hydrogenase expression